MSLVSAASPIGGYDIVICAGQSNMSGRATYNSFYDTLTTNKISQFSCTSASGNYETIINTNWPMEYADGVGSTHIGMEHFFAANYVLNKPSRRLLLVPVAVGGTALASATPSWNAGSPGGSCYENAITWANLAVTAAQAVDATSKVVGIGWMQGESDVSDSVTQTAYSSAMDLLIAGLRSRITGASSSWFAVMQMDSSMRNAWGAAATAIDASHQDTPNRNTNCVFVAGPVGTQYGNGDNLHYSELGQRIIGASWFDAIKSL